MFFQLQKQRTIVWGSDLLWVLKCLFAHSPVYPKGLAVAIEFEFEGWLWAEIGMLNASIYTCRPSVWEDRSIVVTCQIFYVQLGWSCNQVAMLRDIVGLCTLHFITKAHNLTKGSIKASLQRLEAELHNNWALVRQTNSRTRVVWFFFLNAQYQDLAEMFKS